MTDQITPAWERLATREFVLLDLWRESLARFDSEVLPDLSNCPMLLRDVPLAAFGATLLRPDQFYKRANAFLPLMASDEVQVAWTGAAGPVLLETSLAFVNHAVSICGGPSAVRKARVLDFGIGWGRLAPLFLKYMPPSQLDGCDAWDTSLAQARASRLQNRLAKSDPHLQTLPFEAGSYDLIYAFSIFTHLSEACFDHCLAGLSKLLNRTGKIIFTVRPNHYWTLRPDLPHQQALLCSTKFEFVRSEGYDDFGDTSVSLSWLRDALSTAGLKLVGLEWSPVDALQVIAIAERA